ncbi:MAG TPA: DMT family transporter [Devosia sp.]|nr:DMT family transporter [Devosia sp.]
MSLPVFALVLVAAVLHASWNAIVKAGSDTLLTTVLVASFGGLVGLLALPFLPPVAGAAWTSIAISTVLEIVYYALIAFAYRHADMSHAYPLMRGIPPLLVAVVSALFLGTALSLPEWLGIGLISAGILTMLLGTRGTLHPKGLTFALLNALVIAAYTLNDGIGVRLSGAPVTYGMWIFVLTGAPIAAWALARRPQIVAYARRNWLLGLVGGLGTLGSYGLVLFAMSVAPVPLVAALRESSILFATLIAVLVLKEIPTRARIAAALVIAAGVIALRLA